MGINISANTPAIRIENLRTQFGDHIVHRGLDLSIPRGDILSIVGGSGSGKTTLLRAMLGLLRPSTGTISVLDIDVTKANNNEMKSLYNRCGVLFQQGALFSALTVLENIALPLRELRTLPDKLIVESALLKLNMVGLSPEDALKMPSDLSGGMVKRVALARALSLEPDLLFLDEPTAGLDPLLSDSFVDLIQALHDELNLTVVMISHDLDSILQLSSHIAVLADQKVIVNSTPEEVVKTEHPFIREFFLGDRGKRAISILSDVADNPQQETL
jgi:phospholipid/cholesterol/gamma-HCH transport system ATP-binding protein